MDDKTRRSPLDREDVSHVEEARTRRLGGVENALGRDQRVDLPFQRAMGCADKAGIERRLEIAQLALAVKGVLDDMKKGGSYDKLFAAYGVPPFSEPFEVHGPDL